LVSHIETLEAQLKESASRIEELETGTKTSGSRRRIANLKSKYSAARDRLNELKDAGNENWELYKADIWIAWNDLENAFQDFQQSTLAEKRK
jgi:predicted nuclease with TOPRIM domain